MDLIVIYFTENILRVQYLMCMGVHTFMDGLKRKLTKCIKLILGLYDRQCTQSLINIWCWHRLG